MCALLSACASKPLSTEEAVQQFGKGGLWLRPAALFQDLCNIDTHSSMIPCVVVEVRNPMVQVQVLGESRWFPFEELLPRY